MHKWQIVITYTKGAMADADTDVVSAETLEDAMLTATRMITYPFLAHTLVVTRVQE